MFIPPCMICLHKQCSTYFERQASRQSVARDTLGLVVPALPKGIARLH